MPELSLLTLEELNSLTLAELNGLLLYTMGRSPVASPVMASGMSPINPTIYLLLGA